MVLASELTSGFLDYYVHQFYDLPELFSSIRHYDCVCIRPKIGRDFPVSGKLAFVMVATHCSQESKVQESETPTTTLQNWQTLLM